MRVTCLFIILSLLVLPAVLFAGEADVVRVKVSKSNSNYNFEVTVQHSDEGWHHYADKWDVITPEGEILATRILHHPHVNEQPFTRNLSGVEIGAEINEVIVRAHDLVHGYGGQEITVKLLR